MKPLLDCGGDEPQNPKTPTIWMLTLNYNEIYFDINSLVVGVLGIMGRNKPKKSENINSQNFVEMKKYRGYCKLHLNFLHI